MVGPCRRKFTLVLTCHMFQLSYTPALLHTSHPRTTSHLTVTVPAAPFNLFTPFGKLAVVRSLDYSS